MQDEVSENVNVTFIEKDHNLSNLVEFALSHTNHKTIEFTNPQSLFDSLKAGNIQLIAFNNTNDVFDEETHIKKVKIHKKVSLSYKKRRVKVNGEDMHFTKQEFEIISLLYDFQGQVVTRDNILEHIWGLSYTESNIVATSMANIRRKLGKYAKIIETVHGVGYILND